MLILMQLLRNLKHRRKKKSAEDLGQQFTEGLKKLPKTPKEDPKVRQDRLLKRANTLLERTKRFAKHSSDINNWQRFGPSGQGWGDQPRPTDTDTELYFTQLVEEANLNVAQLNAIAAEYPGIAGLAKQAERYAKQLRANVDKYLKSQKGK